MPGKKKATKQGTIMRRSEESSFAKRKTELANKIETAAKKKVAKPKPIAFLRKGYRVKHVDHGKTGKITEVYPHPEARETCYDVAWDDGTKTKRLSRGHFKHIPLRKK